MTDDKQRTRRRRMAGFNVFLGLAMAGVEAHGGNTYGALFALILFGCIAAWHLFGKGDFLDTILQMDERQKSVVSKARERTMVVMAWILVVWAMCDFFQGIFTGPVMILCALSGALFLAFVALIHFRS